MAEKLDHYDFDTPRSRGSRMDAYIDGGVYKLRLGKDCADKASSARSTIRERARLIGKKVRTATEGDNYLIVRAYDPNEEEPNVSDHA